MKNQKTPMESWLSEQLLVYYQPRVSFAETTFSHPKRVTGFEALVRVRSEGKIILPGVFLPYMTDTQKIIVFKTVLNNILSVLESTPDVGSRSLTFGINIEPELISSFRILSALRRIPKKYRKHIVLEILESSVPDYDKFVKAARFLRKKMGFNLALDDFGSGGPSFRLITTTLVGTVKLDTFFVPGKTPGTSIKREKIIVADVSKMLKSMGVLVVAEQIENEKDFRLVKKHVHEGQGYMWGKPAPFAEWKEKNGLVVLKL
jgi:EAL domain-containing protein (putative c-di-GMP-specific phosphodiesterase class I)